MYFAEAVVTAFAVLAAIQPAIALPVMANGPSGFPGIESIAGDTDEIIFTTFSRIYPIVLSVDAADLTFLGHPNNPAFGSVTTSFNVTVNGIIFALKQDETDRIPEPQSLALLSSALVGFGVFRRRRRSVV
jgi:hypothetical protein